MIQVADVLPPGWLDVFSPSHPRIAIGIDPATTTKKTSNPTGIAVTQLCGLSSPVRLVVRLKTGDPDVIEYLVRMIVTGLRSRGLSVRRVCILATNERFWAVGFRRRIVSLAPVELVIESENISYLGETMKVKAYLGNLLVNAIDEGYLPIPREEFLKKDLRSVVKEKGTFNAEVLKDGGHGDCFDGIGASLHGVRAKGGLAQADAVAVGTFSHGPALEDDRDAGRYFNPPSKTHLAT